jgi:hypothetical protein
MAAIDDLNFSIITNRSREERLLADLSYFIKRRMLKTSTQDVPKSN